MDELCSNTDLSASQDEWTSYLSYPNRLIVLFVGAQWAAPSRSMQPVYAQYDDPSPSGWSTDIFLASLGKPIIDNCSS